MTFIYSRVAAPTNKDQFCTNARGTLANLHSPGPAHTDKWIRSDDVLVHIVPGAASAPLTPGRGSAKPHRTRDAFILQKDPGGSWVIDQWNDKIGGKVRPISEQTQNRNGSWPQASENADLFFIIEIS